MGTILQVLPPRGRVMKGQSGLSLIELLASLTAAAVLLVGGVPAFQDLRARGQRSAINNELIATLSLARTEAILGRRPTIVCPMLEASDRCRDDGAWHHGWIAFVDNDDDGQPGGNGDRVLSRIEPIAGAQLSSGRTRPRVRFATNGLNAGSNLSIRLCQRGRVSAAVIVNNVGRSRVELDGKALAEWTCPSGG